MNTPVCVGILEKKEMDVPEGDEPVALQIPPFSRSCQAAVESIWEQACAHPFVEALVDGSLDSDRFRFYQMQDARYLEAFADACSLISVRCSDPEQKLWFIEGARLAIVVEQQLHREYGKRFGYTAQDIAALELTPNCTAYRNHMIASAQAGSLLVALAALAPCPWLYTDIGLRIGRSVDGLSDAHPYKDWLQTYADPGFVTYTNELLVWLEDAAKGASAAELGHAVSAFRASVRYEWMFWEQAWTKQGWPAG